MPSHASKLFESLQDERIYHYQSGGPPESVRYLHTYYELLAKHRLPHNEELWVNWAVRLKKGDYVGIVQTTIRGPLSLLGYDFFPPFWKRGFAREACAEVIRYVAAEFGVCKFEAVVDERNVASIRLLEALGFTRVKTGPSLDMPGQTDHRYERRVSGVMDARPD